MLYIFRSLFISIILVLLSYSAHAKSIQEVIGELKTNDHNKALTILKELDSFPEEKVVPQIAQSIHQITDGSAKLTLLIYGKEMIPYLVKNLYLTDNDQLRQRSAWALTMLGKKLTFSTLSSLLIDPKIGSAVSQIIDYQNTPGFESIFDQLLGKVEGSTHPKFILQNKHARGIIDVEIIAKKNWVISLGGDQKVKLRDLNTLNVLWESEVPHKANSMIVLQKKGLLLVSGWGTIYIINLQSGVKLAEINTNKSPVRLVDKSKNERYILGSWGNSVNFIGIVDLDKNSFNTLLEIDFHDKRFPELQPAHISWFQEFSKTEDNAIVFGNRAGLEWPNIKNSVRSLNFLEGSIGEKYSEYNYTPNTLLSQNSGCKVLLKDNKIKINNGSHEFFYDIPNSRVSRWRIFNGFVMTRLVKKGKGKTADGENWGFSCSEKKAKKFKTSKDYFAFSRVFPMPSINTYVVQEYSELKYLTYDTDTEIQKLSSNVNVPSAFALDVLKRRLYVGYENSNIIVEIDINSGELKGELTTLGKSVHGLNFYSLHDKNFLSVTTSSGTFEIWERKFKRGRAIWQPHDVIEGIEQRMRVDRGYGSTDVALVRGNLKDVPIPISARGSYSALVRWRLDNSRSQLGIKKIGPKGLGRHFLKWGSRKPLNEYLIRSKKSIPLNLPDNYDLTSFGIKGASVFLGGTGWFGRWSREKNSWDWVYGNLPISAQTEDKPDSFIVNFKQENYYDFKILNNNSIICISGSMGTLKCLDAETGSEKWSIKYQHALMGSTFSFDSIASLPKEGALITSGSDGRLRKWRVKTGKLMKVSDSNKSEILDILSNGDSLFTISSNGEVGFWRSSDLRKIGSFFYTNRKEWLSFTNEGYFIASEDGGNIIGMDSGVGVATFSDFKEKLFRPDLVSKAFQSLECCNNNKLKEFLETPRVSARLIKVSQGIAYLSLKSSQSMQFIEINQNSKLVHSLSKPPLKQLQKIKLESGLNHLKISGVSNSGIASNTEEVFITNTEIPRATRFIGIGIENYSDSPLFSPINDLKLIKKILSEKATGFEGELLVNEGATHSSIIQQLVKLEKITRASDVSIIMLSGHGVIDKSGATGLLLKDGVVLAFNEMLKYLEDVKGQTILLIDTCHAGSATLGGVKMASGGAISRSFTNNSNIHLLLSSRSYEYAIDQLERSSNSPFAEAIAISLSTKSDTMPSDGVITFGEISAFVSDKVYNETKGLQLPYTPYLDKSFNLPVIRLHK